MTFLYNIGIRLYYLLILMASPFNQKARLWINGRIHLLNRMRSEIKGDSPIVWFHAASLGEFEQGRPVMEALKKAKPGYKILLTFFSSSGYEVRKNYEGADYIFYLPLDTRRNARIFIETVKPAIAIFIKYEYWYNYLMQIVSSKAKLLIISASFRSNQFFFKPYGVWYRKILRCFDHLFVQDEPSIKLLSEIGVNNASMAGDTRFDRVAQIAATARKIDIAEKFSRDRFTIVCGSTWSKDEDIISPYINDIDGNIRFIIAPHEIDTLHIKSLLQRIKKSVKLYSHALKEDTTDANVLIIDNIGILSSLYKYGQVAYIGGGFGSGIHNILEAAVYGMPVIFGPNYHKFREAIELIAAGGAFSISSYNELKELFDLLQSNKNKLQAASKNAREYVINNLGATKKILNYIIKE